MHMSDALIVPAVAAGMYLSSSAVAGISIKKLDIGGDFKKIPMMGVMGAFVFAGQMINFAIPFTGSSGHLCGGFLLAAILGPYGGFLSMMAVLFIQALLFGDGGLLALGCNVWNMAFTGCFLASFLVYKPMLKKSFSRKKVMIASVLGSILSLQAGAFFVTLQTTISGVSELPFQKFIMVMQPIHLGIGLVEGLITASVLIFIYENRPDLLWLYHEGETLERAVSKKSKKGFVVGFFAVLTVLFAAILSQFASANPDGLEWSIEKTAGDELLGIDGFLHETALLIQQKVAIFPDYGFRDLESPIGTSFAGIFGAIVVLFVFILMGAIVNYIRKKKVYE